MSGIGAVEKRSQRKRNLSSRVRVFDDHTRQEILRKKLESLEADNWQQDKRKDEDSEDDNYNPLDGASSGDEVDVNRRKSTSSKKKKKPKRDAWNATQKCKSLQEVLDEAQYHKYPSFVPTFVSAAAEPSRYPPRNFCSITGLPGKYRCPVTGEYIATLDAYNTHRETRLRGLI